MLTSNLVHDRGCKSSQCVEIYSFLSPFAVKFAICGMLVQRLCCINHSRSTFIAVKPTQGPKPPKSASHVYKILLLPNTAKGNF